MKGIPASRHLPDQGRDPRLGADATGPAQSCERGHGKAPSKPPPAGALAEHQSTKGATHG
eukprot:30811-Alexandrium_andersonii.AAC.1